MFQTLALGIFLIAATAAAEGSQHRRYFPEEDNPHRLRYLFFEDENGNKHIEDLFAQVPRNIRAGPSDVTFHLFREDSKDDPEVFRGSNFEELKASTSFDPAKKIKFIIHGWNNHKDSPVNVLIKNALLSNHDLNVFVVDWSGPANKFYTTSKAAVPEVGEVVGNFVNYIIDEYNVNPTNVTLVGHSLGAHVCGAAGTVIKQKHGMVDYIVGLDPASPFFTVKDTDSRLDPSDANHVHVIHTNGGFLGFQSAIGHADYFPNGGSRQPGCGLDLIGTCAHRRAYEFFAESVTSSGFISHLCDDIDLYEEGICFKNHQSLMGEFRVDQSAEGDYFLKTASEKPYALGSEYFWRRKIL